MKGTEKTGGRNGIKSSGALKLLTIRREEKERIKFPGS